MLSRLPHCCPPPHAWKAQMLLVAACERAATAASPLPTAHACGQGPVRAVAADAEGRHMVTAGADGQVKVWDARKFQPLHAYFSRAPAQWLDVSQRGLLAVGAGRSVQARAWDAALPGEACRVRVPLGRPCPGACAIRPSLPTSPHDAQASACCCGRPLPSCTVVSCHWRAL